MSNMVTSWSPILETVSPRQCVQSHFIWEMDAEKQPYCFQFLYHTLLFLDILKHNDYHDHYSTVIPFFIIIPYLFPQPSNTIQQWPNGVWKYGGTGAAREAALAHLGSKFQTLSKWNLYNFNSRRVALCWRQGRRMEHTILLRVSTTLCVALCDLCDSTESQKLTFSENRL